VLNYEKIGRMCYELRDLMINIKVSDGVSDRVRVGVSDRVRIGVSDRITVGVSDSDRVRVIQENSLLLLSL
jgi:hypothetical protein